MDTFAKTLGNKIGGKSTRVETATYVLTTFAVLEVAENVFNIGAGFSSMDLTGIKLNQIQKGMERIEKKVDKLLQAPLKMAARFYDSALDMVMARKFKDAFDTLNKVIDEATRAFEYTADKVINIETYKECIHAVILITFSTIMKNCYDHTGHCFLPYSSQAKRTKKLIAQELERWANDCINLKKNVKIASWMPGSSKKKSKIQDVLDSILKICYPYMSQGFGWTDFQTDLTYEDATIDVKLHPEYIPKGAEDKVAITVGKAAGRKSALISVWKEGSHVHKSGYRESDHTFFIIKSQRRIKP